MKWLLRIAKKRGVYISFVGIIIHFAFQTIYWYNQGIKLSPLPQELIELLLTIAITVSIWEGNLIIEKIISAKWPWNQSPAKRIVALAISNLLLVTGVIKLYSLSYEQFCCYYGSTAPISEQLLIILSILISFLIIAIKISNWFFKQWKSSLIEAEQFKKNHIEAQYKNLMNQINPHFLFNSLSVLSALVYKNQDRAADFIGRLSKVYRYVLDQRNTDLVALESELDFLRSYIFLLQTRFIENLHFKIEIPEAQLQKMVLPMSLQILVENCIKHNIVTKETPLTINIFIEDDYLIVKNNLNKRVHLTNEIGVGLENISQRYKYFTNKRTELTESTTHFAVKIPLLEIIL